MRKSAHTPFCDLSRDNSIARLTQVVAFLCVIGMPLAASAQETDTTRALRDRIDHLETTLANVQAQLAAMQGTAGQSTPRGSTGAPPASVPGSMATLSSG